MNLKTSKDLENATDTVWVDDLIELAKEHVKHYEQMMEQYSEDYNRELYTFNAGKRSAIVEFFNLE